MRSTLILLGCLTSLALQACANRAPSLRMLDGRAHYNDDAPELKLKASGPFVQPEGEPVRIQPQVHKVWVHPFEMETGDYFWGGYMSLVTKGDQWMFRYPDTANPNFSIQEKRAPIKKIATPEKPRGSNHMRGGER